MAAILMAGFAVLLVDSTLMANVRLTFDSTSLDFGTVAVLGTKDLTLNVLDTSSADIEIDAITPIGSDAGDFKIISPVTPIVVSAHQPIPTQIIIQFSPLAVGTRSASLALETSDGEVIIPLTGTGAGNASNLRWSQATVDFGTIAPYGSRDSIIELYSDGTDTALVSELQIAGADTSFSAELVNGPQPPIRLAPGDSARVRIVLHGLPPAGNKFAQLSAIGSTENTPACDLTVRVQYAGFAIQPDAVIDFGAMYYGEVRDTTLLLIDTSSLDLDFELMDLSPPAQDFSIQSSNPVPFTLHAGDTIPIIIRANPGVSLLSSSQFLAVSPSAALRLQMVTLRLNAYSAQLSAPKLDTVSFYCSDASNLIDSLEVHNSDTQSIVFTGIRFNDLNVPVHSLTLFPDTISPASSNFLRFSFDPTAVTSDTLSLELLGGDQIMWEDTLLLKPTVAVASPLLTALRDSSAYETATLGASIPLKPFALDSIIIDLTSSDSNAATIDPASILLDSAFSADSITSIVPEPGGYRIVILSDSQFSTPTRGPIIHFGFHRYVSSSDSAWVQAAIETPDRGGCIAWSVATLNASSNTVCGGAILRNALSNKPIILEAHLLADPAEAGSVNIRINADLEDECQFDISNAMGGIVSSGSFVLQKNQNDISLPLANVPNGIYFLELRPKLGAAKLLPFTTIR